MKQHSNPLSDFIRAELSPGACEWFEQACSSIRSSDDVLNELLNNSARARRKLAGEQLRAFSSETTHWLCEDSVRAAFIEVAADALSSEDAQLIAKLYSDYYRFGDELEKAALLKSLPVLDAKGHALKVAVNACRANSLVLIEAIVLHNAYPAKFFPELNWNQMVLKGLFLGLNIDAVVGLVDRNNKALSDMCSRYVEEQVLAEREPPASIWLAVDKENLTQKQHALMTSFMTDEAHKKYIEA